MSENDLAGTTFAVITFGCQMNRHDSERVAGVLVEAGYVEAPAADADVILFNTCTVREGAAQRLRGQVASLTSEKRRRPLVVGVLGCLAQAEGESLLERLPHVDLVVGTHRLPDLPALLEAAIGAKEPVVDVGDDARFAADLPRRRESPVSAWIAIAEGCDNRCSYCIVPQVRGPERSRPMEDIVSETAQLADDGVVEVTLLGQNVNSYGRDLYGRPRFAELLEAVDALGIRRIRFTTSHPKDFSDEVIDAIATLGGVCEHVHLPVQSGNDRILAAMGRRYNAARYLERVRTLEKAVPGVAISTDLLIGFPSETESEFEDTLRLVAEVGFSQAFTFIYSPRLGTPAADLTGRVARDDTRRRMAALVAAVNQSALASRKLLVGTTQEVLVEGPAKLGQGRMAGKTRGGHTVLLSGAQALPHTLVMARIVEAQTWSVVGEVRDDSGSSDRVRDAAPPDPRP
jgi:tRNA-2-methylthio-N6-dimethylallyladenosine synthase